MPEVFLPRRYRAYMFLARLTRRLGLRGAALLALGVMAITYGSTLAPDRASFALTLPWTSPRLYDWIGFAWYGVGTLCCLLSLAPTPSADRPAFVSITAACTAWGIALMLGDTERAFARGTVFIVMAALAAICARIPEAPLLPEKSFPVLPPDPLHPGSQPADTPDAPPTAPDRQS